MNAQKTGRLLSLLAGMTVISMTASHAAGASSPAKPTLTKTAAPASAIVVKLGDAMLEEYHNGDPNGRTTILRGGDVAQKAKSGAHAKKQS